MDPRSNSACTDVKKIRSEKIDNDREEGWRETYVYRHQGKCYRVDHFDYQHVSTWASKHYDTWSTPIEIEETEFAKLSASA